MFKLVPDHLSCLKNARNSEVVILHYEFTAFMNSHESCKFPKILYLNSKLE